MKNFFSSKFHPLPTLLMTAVLVLLLSINFSHQINHDLSSSESCSFCVGGSIDGLDATIKYISGTGYAANLLYQAVFYTKIFILNPHQYLFAQTRAPPFSVG